MSISVGEAANILNVSCQDINILIEASALPARGLWPQYRLDLKHVLKYKDQSNQAIEETISELIRINQELGSDD